MKDIRRTRIYIIFNLYLLCPIDASCQIIHCRRHPLDNILSMLRSNLQAGNNYTSDPIDAAKPTIHHEKVMAEIKKTHSTQIFSFNYDDFVLKPKDTLKPLLEWLELEWTDKYLQPEQVDRLITTASVIQARQPIHHNSVGRWKNYKKLLAHR